jgi:uncharacterized SAM-binding protein YcdF (DUF218 family)
LIVASDEQLDEPLTHDEGADAGAAAEGVVGVEVRVDADGSAVPWWRQRPSWARVSLAVLAVLVVYYLVTLVQVVNTGRSDEARPVDAIVVLGAAQYDGRPSPQLAARLDHAVGLWEQGMATWVVATGGNLPGDRFTEAEASAAYLLDRGVPEEAIVSVGVGSTTFESLDAVAATLLARGLDEVILVTDPYHSYRSELIAEEVGLVARVSPTSTSVVTGWTSVRRHLLEAAGISVGRLVGFERLSDLTG